MEAETTRALVKVKGLNLKGKEAGEVITKDSYKAQVQALLSGVVSKIKGKPWICRDFFT